MQDIAVLHLVLDKKDSHHVSQVWVWHPLVQLDRLGSGHRQLGHVVHDMGRLTVRHKELVYTKTRYCKRPDLYILTTPCKGVRKDQQNNLRIRRPSE